MGIGQSPHTTYPFALHDAVVLPWDYALKNGVMKLFARGCRGLSEGLDMACQPCQKLIKNEKLENILRRMEEGIHENAGFAYHVFSGLQQMLHHKNQQIKFYRLRGLNQVGSVTGYPGGFQGNPHPYPSKPAPASTGTGFTGTGDGFSQTRGEIYYFNVKKLIIYIMYYLQQ